MSSPRLEVADLAVSYGRLRALDDVSFAVGAGELVGVLGPNGAGKSTLFRALAGLVRHTGQVTVNGIACHHRLRTDIAFIPQRSDVDPRFPIRVRELVVGGRRRFHRGLSRPRTVDRRAALEAIGRVGLAGMEDRPIGRLSGGQLQRAFLARALAQEAEVMLLDEAMSGVDAPSTAQLFDLFDTLAADGVTLLVSTHDLALARRRFPRCLALNRTVVADGPPTTSMTVERLDATFGSAGRPAREAAWAG